LARDQDDGMPLEENEHNVSAPEIAKNIEGGGETTLRTYQ